MKIETIRKKIQRRRDELKAFDALPAAEQRKRAEMGLNPHDSLAERKRKKRAYNAEVRRRMDKLPRESRDALRDLGFYPDDDKEKIQYRKGGECTAQ